MFLPTLLLVVILQVAGNRTHQCPPVPYLLLRTSSIMKNKWGLAKRPHLLHCCMHSSRERCYSSRRGLALVDTDGCVHMITLKLLVSMAAMLCTFLLHSVLTLRLVAFTFVSSSFCTHTCFPSSTLSPNVDA